MFLFSFIFTFTCVKDAQVAMDAAQTLTQQARVLHDPTFKPTSLNESFNIEGVLNIDLKKKNGKKDNSPKVFQTEDDSSLTQNVLNDFLIFSSHAKVFLLDALIDCWFLFHFVSKNTDKLVLNNKEARRFCKKIVSIEKKLWFFTLWANDHHGAEKLFREINTINEQ